MQFCGGGGISLTWNNKILAHPGDGILCLTKLEANVWWQIQPLLFCSTSVSGKHCRSSLCTHSTLKSHPIADFDLKWLHILLCVYKCGSLKLVLAINNSVFSKVTAGGTAFKWFISLLVIHPEFYEYEPQCHHTLSVDPFSLSWQCCLESQGGKNGLGMTCISETAKCFWTQ